MTQRTISYVDLIPYTKGIKCTMKRSIRGDSTRVFTDYNCNRLGQPLFTKVEPSPRPKGNQGAWRKGQGVPWILGADGLWLMHWYRQQVGEDAQQVAPAIDNQDQLEMERMIADM